jgi:hypothetical protein
MGVCSRYVSFHKYVDLPMRHYMPCCRFSYSERRKTMLPNIQMSDMLALEHRKQLQHEAEQERMLEQAKEHHPVSLGRLLEMVSRFFAAPTSSMKQVEQSDEFIAEYTEEPERESVIQRR